MFDLIASPTLELAGAPAIAGLRFRRFQGQADFPAMLATINAAKVADDDERSNTLEELINNYSHLTNSDPYQDVLIAEVDGQVIAYSRVWWEKSDEDNAYYYGMVTFLRPEWRRKGIGRAILHENERRLREISAGHPQDIARYFQCFAGAANTGCTTLLEQEGYQVVRRGWHMVRPDLENIPDLPLPDGLEVRPVKPEHYLPIWEAFQEAFRDHWGYIPPTEESYQQWQSSFEFQPDIWQIAWDGDQVAGMILNFINHAENEEYGRKRGYTEGIAVRRPWRRRGLARALLARSLKMHRDLGMQEAALGVDTQNLSGANILYESMGFRPVRVNCTYRKRF